MPFYHRLGKIPPKRHTTFYKEDGKSLYREELFSTKGFAGRYANKYHLFTPSGAKEVKEVTAKGPEIWAEATLQWHLFHTDRHDRSGDFLDSRTPWLFNSTCQIMTATPTQNPDRFYRNAYAHEMVFVHRGEGKLKSDFGNISFGPGDYLIIPKGVIWQMHFEENHDNKLFVVESRSPFEIPRHYRSDSGQLLETSPFCERDIRGPEELEIHEDKGDFRVTYKAGDRCFDHTWDHHPFDVVGWDGYEYPFAFNIKEFAPKVGKIHLPPSDHLVFMTEDFVVCNFVPRLFDFHPEAIPAPYYHTNVDSCEVLYYVEGNFMSRKGIEEGSITMHPTGLVHGPQPGKTEASIGVKEVHEYAVMVDTFTPLQLTSDVQGIYDSAYSQSWLEGK